MSKITVKKHLATLENADLRELLLDIYSRSKEAKALLEFYVEPDLAAKRNEYVTLINKELNHVSRRRCSPRLPRIKKYIKEYANFGVGDDAVAEMMFDVLVCYLDYDSYTLGDEKIAGIIKYFEQFLLFIHNAMLWDKFEKALEDIDARKPSVYGDYVLKGYKAKYEDFLFIRDGETVL